MVLHRLTNHKNLIICRQTRANKWGDLIQVFALTLTLSGVLFQILQLNFIL